MYGDLATLATPGDYAVNAQMFSLCPSHRFFDMTRVAGDACNWASSDGTRLTYFKWDTGEPSNGGISCASFPYENCAGFKHKSGLTLQIFNVLCIDEQRQF